MEMEDWKPNYHKHLLWLELMEIKNRKTQRSDAINMVGMNRVNEDRRSETNRSDATVIAA